MSLTVVFRETALRGLARIRSDDKDLFTRTRMLITHLADQSRPENAVAWRDSCSGCRTCGLRRQAEAVRFSGPG
jgi:NAD-dependent dihydropyrimidine dehydrogenase PreA subunit